MTILNMVLPEAQQGWRPGVNTLAYYPLTSTSTSSDMSGNNHTLTTFTGITFETITSGLSVARFSGSSSGNSCKAITDEFTVSNIGTLSIRANPEHTTGTYPDRYVLSRCGYQDGHSPMFGMATAWVNTNFVFDCDGTEHNYISSVSPIVDGKRHHFVATCSTTELCLYIDNVFIGKTERGFTAKIGAGRIYVCCNNDTYYGFKGLVSNAIVENIPRTAQEIESYYNQTKGHYGRQPILPAEYQEVQYIESSGTQYIDTGFYPTGNSEIEYEFEYLNGSAAGSFGVDSGWTVSAFSVFTDRLFCYGNQYQNTGSYFTTGTKYKLEFKNLQCYLNGTYQFTYTQNTFTSGYSAYLFAKRRNNTIEMYSKTKTYSLKLWNNGILERNFIPCYRISDGVIGMYDLVNNVFYTNNGSGTFTKGPDV